MSAAATAAGYLYASGRLRGRTKEGPQEARRAEAETQGTERRRLRVAALPDPADSASHRPGEAGQAPQQRPRRTPTVQYRTRRWRPDTP